MILFCLSFYCFSVLVYHWYTNANIGPWGMETWLNIFFTIKYSNIIYYQSQQYWNSVTKNMKM